MHLVCAVGVDPRVIGDTVTAVYVDTFVQTPSRSRPDNAVTSCIIHALVNASHLGMAVHELRYARARMTEEHLQKHYQTAFMTPEKDVAKPPLIKTSRPILTKCPSSGRAGVRTFMPAAQTMHTFSTPPQMTPPSAQPCLSAPAKWASPCATSWKRATSTPLRMCG